MRKIIFVALLSVTSLAQAQDEMLDRAKVVSALFLVAPEDKQREVFEEYDWLVNKFAEREELSPAVAEFLVKGLRHVNGTGPYDLPITERCYSVLETLGRKQKPLIRAALRGALFSEINELLKNPTQNLLPLPTELAMRFLLPKPLEPNFEEVPKLIQKVMLEASKQDRMSVVESLHEVIMQYELGGSEWYDRPTPAMEELLKTHDRELALFQLEAIEQHVTESRKQGVSELQGATFVSEHMLAFLRSANPQVRAKALATMQLITQNGYASAVNPNELTADDLDPNASRADSPDVCRSAVSPKRFRKEVIE